MHRKIPPTTEDKRHILFIGWCLMFDVLDHNLSKLKHCFCMKSFTNKTLSKLQFSYFSPQILFAQFCQMSTNESIRYTQIVACTYHCAVHFFRFCSCSSFYGYFCFEWMLHLCSFCENSWNGSTFRNRNWNLWKRSSSQM